MTLIDQSVYGVLATGAMGLSALIEGFLIIHFTEPKKSARGKHSSKTSKKPRKIPAHA
jgi:hypothetical protein